MSFYDWVLAQLPPGKQIPAEAARRIGVSESTVSRWKTGGVQMKTVRQVVDALPGAQILGAMIAAGIITAEEAEVTEVEGPPRELTDEEFVEYLQQRLGLLSTIEQQMQAAISDLPPSRRPARSTTDIAILPQGFRIAVEPVQPHALRDRRFEEEEEQRDFDLARAERRGRKGSDPRGLDDGEE